MVALVALVAQLVALVAQLVPETHAVVQYADKQSAGIVPPALPYSTLQCSPKVLTWKARAERRRRRASNEGESKQEGVTKGLRPGGRERS
jgi:hypothetical protein